MKKPTIGVFFGSRSPEHDVSIITGQLIISGLRGLDYPVIAIYINKEGEWLLGEDLGKLQKFVDPTHLIDGSKYRKYVLDLELSREQLVFRKKGGWSKSIIVNIAFPAFHGPYGEDGTIQGLLEMLNVPYVGCGVSSSALTMDKIFTKQLYLADQIPTTKFLYYTRKEWESEKKYIQKVLESTLHFPIFIKPSRLGSSIGMTKVKEPILLERAIELALHFSERFIAEESVENLMDVTCALFGNENPTPSLLQESVFGDDLFSYEDKYLREGGAQFGNAQNQIFIPARLDKKTTESIQTLAIRIYRLLGCAGTARVDFLYDKQTQNIYANEVNTMPGTLYHHLWKKSGVGMPKLLETLLSLAQEQHIAKKMLTQTFESDLLRQASSTKLHLKKDAKP